MYDRYPRARMSIDLVVATPTFLDLTFIGLEGLPEKGEERFAADLVRSPGGGAITAVGAARLGLSTALAAPLGDDDAGDFVRGCLERDGITLPERRSPRTPTTVVMPVDGDRSMVTVDPGVRASAADVAGLKPRAVACSLDQLYCVPDGAAGYVTCGDDDARAFARRPPAQLAGARALFVSQREALTLTEEEEVEAAAAVLARSAQRVIVTLGAQGAMAVVDGQSIFAPAIKATALDTTGAGDLLVAAYIWGDLRGASPEESLRWAVLYAGLSIATPTGVGGAVSEARLLEEGSERGLAAPPVTAP
jgi:sugar/nucleoside kinase (ribokinase family)